MARGPIIISSGSRNKLLRPNSFLPFIGSAWRGLLLSGPSESNGPYPLELDATLAMCLVLCSRTLDSFPRGRTCELQCGRERENEVRTRDRYVDKQRMAPRNFSQDQGTLLPYIYMYCWACNSLRAGCGSSVESGRTNTIVEQQAGSACGVENCKPVESNKSSRAHSSQCSASSASSPCPLYVVAER